MLVSLRAGPELDRGVGEHGAHRHEDEKRHPHRDVEQLKLRAGDRALRDHGRLVAVHPPEIEVAAREQEQERNRGEGTQDATGGS